MVKVNVKGIVGFHGLHVDTGGHCSDCQYSDKCC